jgi:short-subunit dehydrogenase
MSEQQTILITGAAAGIGRHAALYLAKKGHRVIASGRKASALAVLAVDAAKEGLSIEVVELDVTRRKSIAAAKARVDELTEGRGVDVLINNAGYGLAAPLAEATDADLRAQFDTNVFGLMAVTRAFLPAMLARGRGRILNVSSVGGRVTFPLMGAYHASKYAVEAMSDALRYELAPFGIDVVVIEPGPIQTGFVERMNQALSPYRHEGSMYAAIFDRAERVEHKTMAMAPGPMPVSRAIHRAVTARRPRARYVAPGHNLISLALLALMPTRLRDAIFRAVFGLSRRHLVPVRELAATESA